MLDMRTVMFSNIYIFIICTLVMALLRRQARDRFAGMGHWLADFAFQTIAVILISLRGQIPATLSILLANILVIVGAFLGYVGYCLFIGRKKRQVRNIVLLIAFTAVQGFFTHIQPNLQARSFNIALCLGLICFQSFYLLAFRSKSKPYARAVALINGGYVLVNFFRLGMYILHWSGTQDYFASGLTEILFQVAYQILFILLTCGIFLMVNKALLTGIQTEREKFSKAFHSSPNAILLTNMEDGAIFEVNEAFTRLTGYSPEEAIGTKTLDLGIWDPANDRSAMVQELEKNGRLQNREILFRTKSGDALTGLLSMEIIIIEGKKTILSSFSDISDRKRMEEHIRGLLAEKELLLKEVHHRIKNNLNTVISLLEIQADNANEAPEAARIIGIAADRMRSMSQLYDKLYRFEHYTELPLNSFLDPLIREIADNFPNADAITIETSLDDRTLDLRLLTPLGIITNELVTNAMKYAFPKGRRGRLRASSRGGGKRFILLFEDDGIGFGDSVALDTSSGFGITLVRMLCEQIGARLRVENERGTRFVIEFEA